MGVLGLWQLLAPVGQPVTLESLENKIFAVDISIWLNQALKGYRDSQGGSVPNAHLLSLFSRLSKLLFYKIKPIVVFDGGFPELKKQTIINRQQRRAALKESKRDVGLKILTNYLASQQLEQNTTSSSFGKCVFKTKEKPRDELFKLAPLPENSQNSFSDLNEGDEDYERKFTNFSREDIKYLNQIDIDSEDFNGLPPDVKQEILSTLKESRKHRSWDQFDELPKESKDFSNYQMQCLLKRRKLQSKLEQVQRDIRQIHSSAYVSQYTNDHVIGETNKIMSDDVSYYVLLKKIIDKKENSSKSDNVPSSSFMADTKNAFLRDVENIDIAENYSKISSDNANQDELKVKSDVLSMSDDEYEVDNPPEPFKNVANQDELKVKNDALNVSNDEYEVDNPPETFENFANQDELKVKSNSLDISNDEYEVDNPPETLKNVNNGYSQKDLIACDMNLTSNTQDFAQHSFVSDLKFNTLRESDTKFEHDPVNSDISVLSIRQESSNVKDSLISVTASSEDEMVSCDEIDDDVNVTFSEKYLEEKNNIRETNVSDNSFNEQNVDILNENVLDKSSSKHSQSDTELNSSLIPQTSDSAKIEVNANLSKANSELQKNLTEAAAILEAEQAKKDRQSNTVQEHMIEECKELLKLFGIPFIISPLEAEAQCAFFDKIELTHGTITDDSDVWLFGGKRVYKNFFAQQKFVESYKDKEIFTHFGLSRTKLINFALLTGSDYTEGIEGVGPVTAMEIISEFPGDDIDSLENFKKWWADSNKHARPPENKVRAKLLKLILPQNFPDSQVFDAYLNPEVDDNTEKFTWGRPDLDALREYAREKFGWNQNKVDDALLPVLKKLNERDKQMHLDSFFTVNLKKETNLFPSKRIMSALKKITTIPKVKTETSNESKAVKRKSSSKKKIPKKVIKKSSKCKNPKAQNKGPILSEDSSSDSNN